MLADARPSALLAFQSTLVALEKGDKDSRTSPRCDDTAPVSHFAGYRLSPTLSGTFLVPEEGARKRARFPQQQTRRAGHRGALRRPRLM